MKARVTRTRRADKPVRTRKLRAEDVSALRAEVARRAPARARPRWNPDPDDAQRSVAQLVLALVEFLRKLLERQAIRRMDQKTLTAKEVEAVGVALMQLEKTVGELAERFGIDPEDLNLDLGPLGKLH